MSEFRPQRSVVYYVSGHGLGHATRSVGVIQSLLNKKFFVHIVTSLNNGFFLENLSHSSSYQHHQRCIDSGAIQSGPLRVDPIATLESYRINVYQRKNTLLSVEIDFLKDLDVSAVIVDASALACRAGRVVGVPTIILANFTWDYCYDFILRLIKDTLDNKKSQEYEEMIVDCTSDYAQATHCVTLPATCPLLVKYVHEPDTRTDGDVDPESSDHGGVCVINGPMVCRKAEKSRAEIRAIHDLSDSTKVVILGFGGFKRSDDWVMKESFLPEGWVCFVLGAGDDPATAAALPDRFIGLPFNVYIPDYISMADVVLGKLGYGTVTECLLHDTPLIYIRREYWPEEPFLEDLLCKRAPAAVGTDASSSGAAETVSAGVEMKEEDFLSGEWHAALAKAYKCRGTWTVADLRAATAFDEVVDIVSRLTEK